MTLVKHKRKCAPPLPSPATADATVNSEGYSLLVICVYEEASNGSLNFQEVS